MLKLNFHPTGRHFLQIPGPSPVPDRILRAMAQPTIGISQRVLLQLFSSWATYVGLRIHGHSACISHLRLEAERTGYHLFPKMAVYL